MGTGGGQLEVSQVQLCVRALSRSHAFMVAHWMLFGENVVYCYAWHLEACRHSDMPHELASLLVPVLFVDFSVSLFR